MYIYTHTQGIAEALNRLGLALIDIGYHLQVAHFFYFPFSVFEKSYWVPPAGGAISFYFSVLFLEKSVCSGVLYSTKQNILGL